MSTPAPPTDVPEELVAIVGVGLIGGSIAAAIRRRRLARHIIGLGRNADRLGQACSRSLIDEFTLSPAEAARAGLIFVCTPIDRIVADVRRVSEHAPAETLITDAGSVKRRICGDLAGDLPENVTFIGAHPMAGSDRQGFEHADPDLFENRICIVSPNAGTPPRQLSRLVDFWKRLGATVISMSADAHDRIVAQTSHLPHVVAAALAATLMNEERICASSGFRDTSRVAGGDPELWVEILLENADQLVPRVDAYGKELAHLREALAHRDAATLKSLLEDAKRKRDALTEPPGESEGGTSGTHGS